MGKIFLRLHKNWRDEECATGSNTHRHVYACWTMFCLNSSHLDTNPQSPTRPGSAKHSGVEWTVSREQWVQTASFSQNIIPLSHTHAHKLPWIFVSHHSTMCGSAYDNKIDKRNKTERKKSERKNKSRAMKEKRIVVYDLQNINPLREWDDMMMVKRNRVDLNKGLWHFVAQGSKF